MRKTTFAFLLLASQVFCAAPASPDTDASLLSFQRLRFQCRGRNVQIDLYEPPGNQSHRTILCLYGAGGLVFDGSRMRVTAQRLVQARNRVYLLHYFNQTHTFVAARRGMRKEFPTWLQTVHDAIDWISQQPGSSGLIGVYGFSLGGFLALAVASDNPHVGAVVEQSGGIASEELQNIGRMPPLLLVHGGRDKWVPFKEYAEPLVNTSQEHRVKFETCFFPREGHKFKPAALEETRARAIAFFDRYLQAENRSVWQGRDSRG